MTEVANIIFGIGSVCFGIALLPAVVHRRVPPVSSCVLTAFWLWTFLACYVGLGWLFSAGSDAVDAAMWTVMLGVALAQRPRLQILPHATGAPHVRLGDV